MSPKLALAAALLLVAGACAPDSPKGALTKSAAAKAPLEAKTAPESPSPAPLPPVEAAPPVEIKLAPEPAFRGMAKLGVALGKVEVKAAADPDYKPLDVGGTIEENTWVRTPAGSKCTLDYSDGAELRVNESTELQMEAARKIVLKVGQVYAKVPTRPPPFKIQTQFSPIELTAGGAIDVAFIHRDPNDPKFKTISRTLTRVHVLDGRASVGSKRYTQGVGTGYFCQLVDVQLNTPDPIGYVELTLPWIHDLLVARDPNSPELKARLDGLLNLFGQTRSAEAEAVYKAMGEAGVPFLAAFMKEPYEPRDKAMREVATKVMAEIASPARAEALAALLKDKDADVRVQAARGLERLANQNQGFDEKYWRGDKLELGQKVWEAWAKKAAAEAPKDKKK